MIYLDKKGQSVLEVIVAVAIFGLVASSLASLAVGSNASMEQGGEHTQAENLAQEAIEAVKSIRDRAWNELVYNSSGITTSSNRWLFKGEATNNQIGQFYRNTSFTAVCRDGLDNIIDCPGNYIDVNSKKMTVSIDWLIRPGVTNTIWQTSYLTNWDSTTWQEDLSVDFNDGTFEATELSTSLGDGDGAITLEALEGESQQNWQCLPKIGSYNASGNTNALAVSATGTYSFIGQGSNIRSYDISNPAQPSELDSYGVDGTVYDIKISGNYAYLATSANSKEMIVIDISNPADLDEIGYYNADSNEDANAIYIEGNRAYLVTQDNDSSGINPEFYIINITNPATPSLAAVNSHYDIGDDVNGVYVTGTFAYLATENSSGEFVVLNISDEASVVEETSVDISGSRRLMDVVIKDNYAYVSTGQSWGRLYSIDISIPASSTIADYITYNNTDFNDLEISSNNLFLATDVNDQELVIVDITEPTALATYATKDYDDDLNSLFIQNNVIIVASDSNSEEMGIYQSQSQSSWYCIEEYGAVNISGNNDGLKVYVREENSNTIAYIIQDERLYAYDVTNTSSPVLQSYYDSGDDINDMTISGNYAYLATDNNSKEMIVVDVSDLNDLQEVGSYNADSNSNAYSIFVSSTRAYLGTDKNKGSNDPEFYILDISTPSSPVLVNANSWFNTEQRINSIFVKDNYAYLATVHNSSELWVLDTSNESNISTADTYNSSGNNDGRDVYVEGNYAYLTNGNGNDLFIINISNPNNVLYTSQYNANNDTAAIVVDGNYAFLSTYDNGNELQILDISDKSNPVLMNSYDNDGQWVYDVVIYDDILYLANGNNSAEVQMIKKQNIDPIQGAQSGAYQSGGSYISSAFDMGENARATQVISWTEFDTGCLLCDISLQIRTSPTEIGLDSASWSGPSGSGTYYVNPTGSLIPISHNGDRWLQYRVEMIGDSNSTPILSDISLNYK